MNMQKYQKLLSEFVSYKSISPETKCTADIVKCGEWVHKLFHSIGFKSKIVKGFGNPIILANIIHDKSLPTCLIYGHYDVQPVNKMSWETNPFQLCKKNDRLFARGVVDNKGQILLHMMCILDLMQRNKPGYNVRFIVEGDEETGSKHIEKFINNFSKDLKADFILVSDGALVEDNPTLEISLRGTMNISLKIETSTKELHSGVYGGVVPNPIFELSKILSKVERKNRKNELFVSNKHNIDEPKKDTKTKIDSFKHSAGVSKIFLNELSSLNTSIGLRPTIQPTGIVSGYTNSGYKTSIPNTASVKLNVRIVPGQTISDTIKDLKQALDKIVPTYVNYKLYDYSSKKAVEAFEVNKNNKYFKKAKKVLQSVYSKEVIMQNVGGTIPILSYFDRILKIPQVLVPFANHDNNMHGANENFAFNQIKNAYNFCYQFFQ